MARSLPAPPPKICAPPQIKKTIALDVMCIFPHQTRMGKCFFATFIGAELLATLHP